MSHLNVGSEQSKELGGRLFFRKTLWWDCCLFLCFVFMFVNGGILFLTKL